MAAADEQNLSMSEVPGLICWATIPTLGLRLAVQVTPANEQERAQVAILAEHVQAVTGNQVEVTFACVMLQWMIPLLTPSA